MQRSILAVCGILLLVSTGAFFLYVSILSIMAVVVLLVALMLMFFLGIQAARQEFPLLAIPSRRKLRLARGPAGTSRLGSMPIPSRGGLRTEIALAEHRTLGVEAGRDRFGWETHMRPDKHLECLDDLIADLGGSDASTHSKSPYGLLIEHLQAARRDLLGSMRAEYGLSLRQATESVTCISDNRARSKTKGALRRLLAARAPKPLASAAAENTLS